LNNRIISIIDENKTDFFRFLNRVASKGNKLMVKGNLIEILKEFEEENETSNIEAVVEVLNKVTESIVRGSFVYFEIRETVGSADFYAFNIEESYYEKVDILEFLKIKENFVNQHQNNNLLTLNFTTFYDKFPSVREPKGIGHGVEYLNRYLSSRMFTEPEKLRKALFEFLFVHKYKSQQLILNGRINSPEILSQNLDRAIKYLRKKPADEPFSNLKLELQLMGFETGLGNTAYKIVESLKKLDRLLQSPDYLALQEFLSGIPMLFNIAIISPHGYFGQEGVLGKPDTGGQVVYILDQVKALESELLDSLREAGVEAKPKIIILTRLIPNADGTKCNQRLEKVHETKNSWILRVPFRTINKNVTDNWISRFEIWPYLETFAQDAYKELLAEFGERPDLVIGNYSDGNMVAYILSREFGVTQCNIAHALEKSKYLYSAMYWKNLEDHYHFSIQFTADLIAMNAANFIITSSYQEIAGTDDNIGQYESYCQFTMPELYRVVGGINLFHPKFNIVPPGVNTKIYFPYYEDDNRLKEIHDDLNNLLFENSDDPDVLGKIDNPDLIPIFSMARLDKIKNLTGLVSWYGESEELQKIANLIIVAGNINPDRSTDNEEREQIHIMHDLINRYKIQNKIRWIGKLFRKDHAGEVYRIVADKKGIFVQPALFEGFGLTVLEAMRSGLPVFATQYGGPSEILEDEISGFNIDPINSEETIEKILDFLNKCKKDISHWEKISNNAIKRVDTEYNWELYAKNLLSYAKIYGFWRYTTNIEMEEMNSYLDVIYHLLYIPKARQILELHNRR
jgi:sucrose synthase